MAATSLRYGYGFSFVYTKAAWDSVKFPDTEWSEDGEPWPILALQFRWVVRTLGVNPMLTRVNLAIKPIVNLILVN